jgi:hypothetical protein
MRGEKKRKKKTKSLCDTRSFSCSSLLDTAAETKDIATRYSLSLGHQMSIKNQDDNVNDDDL